MTNVPPIPCPKCCARDTLGVEDQMIADPIGKASLAGMQLKTTMRHRPVLTCSACGMALVGEYDDGHVQFTVPKSWD